MLKCTETDCCFANETGQTWRSGKAEAEAGAAAAGSAVFAWMYSHRGFACVLFGWERSSVLSPACLLGVGHWCCSEAARLPAARGSSVFGTCRLLCPAVLQEAGIDGLTPPAATSFQSAVLVVAGQHAFFGKMFKE